MKHSTRKYLIGITLGAILALVCILVCGCESIPELPDMPDFQPTPQEDESPDDIPVNEIDWLGANYSGAQVDMDFSGGVFNDGIWLNEPAASHWPKTTVKVRVQGILCLFYGRDSFRGGKMEWLTPGQTYKLVHNLKTGYNGHRMPKDNERVFACLVSVDGSRRSNIAELDR